MRKILPALLFCALIIAGCSNPTPEEPAPSLTTSNDTMGISDSYSGSTDTLHINEPLVLITWPDSIMQEQLKAKDSDAFYVGADDYSFYSSGLMMDADSLGIKSMSSSLKYIDFMVGGKHWTLDRSPEYKWWGMYVYNGKDTPAVYGVSADNKEFLKKYFNK